MKNLQNNKYDKLYYIDFFNNKNNINFNKKIDIIFKCGGLKGLYYLGCCYIINKYIDPKYINSITGCSIGSLASVLLACNIDIYKCRNSYDILYQEYKNHNSMLNGLKKICKYLFPADAYKICNKRNVSFIVSKITFMGISRSVLNNFKSNKHLIKCIIASSNIPYLYNNGAPFFQNINNEYYLDGFFTEDMTHYLSCDKFNNCYKKIIFDLNITYKIKYTIYPTDHYIDKLILLGLYDTYNFFSTEINNENIYNYDIKIHKINLNKIFLNKCIKYIILFYILNEILFVYNIKFNTILYKIYKFQKTIIDIIILFILLYFFFLNKLKVS